MLLCYCGKRAIASAPDASSIYCEGNTPAMSLATDLAPLFRRDLKRLQKQIEAFPTDEMLWEQCPGMTNSAGNLALHIEGNLREYVGRQLGQLPYQRTRDLEFSSKGVTRQELAARISELVETIPAIVGAITAEQLEAEYPQVVLEKPLTTQAFLIHIYGHLNWHLGQVDSLRRVLSGSGALPRTSV